MHEVAPPSVGNASVIRRPNEDNLIDWSALRFAWADDYDHSM